jgi:hypothetical protein
MRLQPFDRFVYPPPHNSRREHARAWVAGGSAGRQDAARTENGEGQGCQNDQRCPEFVPGEFGGRFAKVGWQDRRCRRRSAAEVSPMHSARRVFSGFRV